VGQVVASTPAPQLFLHSVVLARSGTLLLTWVDPTGRVAMLRKRLQDALPGATPKQVRPRDMLTKHVCNSM
jgi:hypothetical protein